MPPIAAAAAFLVLEFVAGNGRIPHAVFAALLASLSPPSPRNSPRLRKAIALRALDAALHAEDAASTVLLLRKVRVVLANPEIAGCFPQLLSFSLPDDKYDEVTAAAAMADIKRILDHEWASLPPSTLELAADRISGAGALETWVRADGSKRRKLRLLVGDSMEREIVAKLEQDAYASRPSLVPHVDKSFNVNDANETDHAQGDDEAHPSKESNEAECAQVAHARAQQASVKGAMEDKWDGLGHSDDERSLRHRQLPPFERKLKPSPTVSHKTKKKWSEIQEKALLEGVEKYGKGNWKDIKMAYPGIFEDRSIVDLKDKFRNMERHQFV